MKKVFIFIVFTTVVFGQVKKIPFKGSSDTVIVSGSLYYKDAGPASDDPLAGVVIWYVGNKEDGSSAEATVLKGTTYYKTKPDTLIFTPNTSTGDTLYAFAIAPNRTNAQSFPLLGKYTIKVNGKIDSITAANIYYFLDLPTGVAYQEIGQLAKNFKLQQNYPNPFNPSTKIDYQLSTSAHVQINIYNEVGQLVRSFGPEEKGAGSYTKIWDGKDDFGKLASSGTYYYQVQAGEGIQTKKMILLK